MIKRLHICTSLFICLSISYSIRSQTVIPEAELMKAGSPGTTVYYKSDGTLGSSSNHELTITSDLSTLWGYNDYYATYGISGSPHYTDPSDPDPNFEGLIIGGNNETSNITMTFDNAINDLNISFQIYESTSGW